LLVDVDVLIEPSALKLLVVARLIPVASSAVLSRSPALS
jgi:hypothetical protein